MCYTDIPVTSEMVLFRHGLDPSKRPSKQFAWRVSESVLPIWYSYRLMAACWLWIWYFPWETWEEGELWLELGEFWEIIREREEEDGDDWSSWEGIKRGSKGAVELRFWCNVRRERIGKGKLECHFNWKIDCIVSCGYHYNYIYRHFVWLTIEVVEQEWLGLIFVVIISQSSFGSEGNGCSCLLWRNGVIVIKMDRVSILWWLLLLSRFALFQNVGSVNFLWTYALLIFIN